MAFGINVRLLPFYDAWIGFSGSIPDAYWGIESDEQRYLWLCKRLCKLVEYSNTISEQVNLNTNNIADLAEIIAKWQTPEYFEANYKTIVEKWIGDNLKYIFEHAIKQIYVGLTYDGHFCIYVPESWSDITFDTGMVYGRSDYGRLILRFESDGAINNTYGYTNAQLQTAQKAIADFESEIKRIDAAFDTLFTNINEEVVLNGNI